MIPFTGKPSYSSEYGAKESRVFPGIEGGSHDPMSRAITRLPR
jgi:hypothetical protein